MFRQQAHKAFQVKVHRVALRGFQNQVSLQVQAQRALVFHRIQAIVLKVFRVSPLVLLRMV